jgi:hypothetical protein
MKEHPTHKGYFVTEDGRVFKNGKEIKGSIDHRKGGIRIRLDTRYGRKRVYIHRMVAETFIPNPNNLPVINHKDENRNNNVVDNLEWCNQQYNSEYSNAKWHKIKTPNGEVLEVFNLNKFCKENNLSQSNLSSGNFRYKGFTLLETSQS